MTSPCSSQTRRAALGSLSSLTSLVQVSLVLALGGCPNNPTVTETDPDTTATPDTTGDATTATATNPTTTIPTTGELTTTGDDLTTTGATTEEPGTTDPGTSTGTEPTVSCTDLTAEDTCMANQDCKWGGVLEFTYGAQGCQGAALPFCTSKMPSGGASAWYRVVKGDNQVVEFGYTPTDLDEEWKPCDCDGPLACLCTSVTEDCPERQEQFCGVNINELGCSNATFKGNPICAWMEVTPEGAPDDACAVMQAQDRCLPATDAGSKVCEESNLPPYPDENNQNACNPNLTYIPVYWREVEGTIELIQVCGPVPVGFTRCEAEDTPDQPDECKCPCLDV